MCVCVDWRGRRHKVRGFSFFAHVSSKLRWTNSGDLRVWRGADKDCAVCETRNWQSSLPSSPLCSTQQLEQQTPPALRTSQSPETVQNPWVGRAGRDRTPGITCTWTPHDRFGRDAGPSFHKTLLTGRWEGGGGGGGW